ncbi:MAG: type VII secretion protein EssC [Peptococcaceae bacterium]|nr:type VII secretion protein EssC [Peptococcaceae bacterium]
MIVSLITKTKLLVTTLPKEAKGRYWLHNAAPSTEASQLISIEGFEGQWIMKSNHKTVLMDGETPLKTITLQPCHLYTLRSQENQTNLYIYTEPITRDRQQFNKYKVNEDADIPIGRHEDNHIVISQSCVSGHHARLIYQQRQWSVTDLDSSNGTYVNGTRITRGHQHHLKPGHIVTIVAGLKIIIGSDYFVCNNPDQKMLINTKSIEPLEPLPYQRTADEDEESQFDLDTYLTPFSRSPRFKNPFVKPVFNIEAPPNNQEGEKTSLMQTLGPSLTMGIGMLTMASFSVSSAITRGNMISAIPSMGIAISMLGSIALWPTVNRKMERKRRKKKELLRQEKYTDYIRNLRNTISQECTRQETLLRENFIPIDACVSRIRNMERTLWERGPKQDDFLQFRLGVGESELDADVKYPERRFTLEDDNLQDKLHALGESAKPLRSVPITLSLYEDYISGVIGDRKQAMEIAQGLIIQIAALYSCDEVKLVIVYAPEDEQYFGFTKWLPHVWDDNHSFRFLATTPREVKEVSAHLEKEIEHRAGERNTEDMVPYYIIFSLSHDLSQRADILKQIYLQKKNLCMSVLTFYDKLKNLPKECTLVVELDDQGTSGELSDEIAADTPVVEYYPGIPVTGKLYYRDNPSTAITPFTPDIRLDADPQELSIQLANIRLDTLSDAFNLPSKVSFLELFGVGKIEHLNSRTRWKENDPTKSLEASVGIDTLGGHFKLDIHEKFHGPHGLVAGMTGSGKSEFLMTYILAMAINYHPHEVAFILIDYKGGGMAKAFENLPHTTGVITNLDGAALSRSLVSIQSELKRRQAVFAETSLALNISNIDIYSYQQLYREGAVREPLQHLILIADEFAELKTQEPEFMTQIVSAARIGRSLGVHLILATQKPSGIVTDQIWSNSRFKICLKVQDKTDSQDMIKRPDAAELIHTGRFYLQVGYNELFEIGQSAWAGAPYHPADKVTVEKDDSVVVIDRNGRPLRAAKPSRKKAQQANPPKQLDAITDYLIEEAKEAGVKVRSLWLPPLDPEILLSDTKAKYAMVRQEPFILNPIIGEYDDPARQRQEPLALPLSADGNVIVYGSAGSGKTSFINALVTSLTQDHTPDEVALYLLDFSTETLRAFSPSPHVGDVVLNYEKEKITNLFKMLQEETSRRKKLFADYGGSYVTYARTKPQSTPPNIIVVIHNFAAFQDMYEEKSQELSILSREGTKYGVHLILTCLSTSTVRSYLQTNFKQHFILQMNNPDDYYSIVGKTDGLSPAKHIGRGLVNHEGVKEFQISRVTSDLATFDFIRSQSLKLRQEWTGPRAPAIPILPEIVDAQFLSGDIRLLPHDQDPALTDLAKLTFPIGVETSGLKTHLYPFGESYISLVLGSGKESRLFLYDLARMFADQCGFEVILIDPLGTFTLDITTSLNCLIGLTCATTQKDCIAAVDTHFDIFRDRNNTYKDTLDLGEIPMPYPPTIILITAFNALHELLSEEGQNKLAIMLEKGSPAYNLLIILSEQSQNLKSTSFKKWFQTHISEKIKDYIWIGGRLGEQYDLELSQRTKETRADLPPGFGYSVHNGNPTRVKLLCSEIKEAS